MLQIINNTLVVDDHYLNNLDQKDAELIKSIIGQDINQIQTKTELREIIKKTSIKDAENLISFEFGQDNVKITECNELGTYLIRLATLGLHSNAPINIIIAIHKIYTGIIQAEEQVRYLKALGFGMHKECRE